MGIFSKKEKSELVAIFDIGSGSVGGAIARISKESNSIPHILASVRTEIAFRDTLNFKDFLPDMAFALGKTAQALYNTKSGAPERVICTLASPWYVSETRLIQIEREAPFIFTQKIADDLMQKELSALVTEYSQKFGIQGGAPEIIEHKIVSVFLNGYMVNNPLSKRSKKVEMNMVVTLAPSLCLEPIRETLSDTYHSKPVSFSSFMTSTYLAVRDKYLSEDSFLLVDVGGEITDIAVISRNILKASLSFPFGRQTFYRSLKTNFALSKEQAESLFSMYMAGTLEATQKEKLEPVLASIRNSWSEGFRQSIAALPRTVSLPGTVFMIADQDVKRWFADSVQCEEYIKSLMAGRVCQVLML